MSDICNKWQQYSDLTDEADNYMEETVQPLLSSECQSPNKKDLEQQLQTAKVRLRFLHGYTIYSI